MKPLHYLRDEIAVVGWACRLPGANSPAELWSLLLEGRCVVSQVPAGRFSLDRFAHPGRQVPGKSYTWAAGIIDDPWGFDPGVFGISPREAEQMDPQQRILLQMTWEALEDAGIRPSTLAGSDVGVFVGASQTDYAHALFADYAVADAQFATGTSLAVLANRISYIYDLRGPSIAVDTACSSSIVALHQAMEALRSGRIDTAIVGGINVIASPASFIAFSQASMLSKTGLCQAFSANADGFVRGEGGAVLVLRKAAQAHVAKNPIHGIVVATDVNSDGRTNGISLPSLNAQHALLERIYSRNGIDANRLAFVEAHGTGTAAGDPIEANALGGSIGARRNNPLPIGSVKTNIGHLEPASGMPGLLKSFLALNHGILPQSLHFSEPNPNIDFDRLNLQVCDESLLLPHAAESYAGVNSFGFGGTNAHAVLAPGRKVSADAGAGSNAHSSLFAFSAESKAALSQLAQEYAHRVDHLTDEGTAALASAVAHRRDHLSHRVVVASSRASEVSSALDAFIAGREDANLLVGEAHGTDNAVAFVYSGNGSQWVGMGVQAYRNNEIFRQRFDLADGYFRQIAGWSLKDALLSDTLADRLPKTSVAQPLIFAIECASTAALRARGLDPAMVVGHSVGEVAAAEAAGILDLRTAVRVIYGRSKCQELTFGSGRMAAVLAPLDSVERMIAEVGGLEIAAINSPRAVTIAGLGPSVAAFKAMAGRRGIAVVELDLDYPFHTTLMAPVEKPLAVELKGIRPNDGDLPLVSTVTGECMPGSKFDAGYWWRNVREPVQFADAIRMAAKLGARYFIEIGPRATLVKHITDNLSDETENFAAAAVLDRNDSDVDPFDKAVAKALVSGAQIDFGKAFASDPGPAVSLPFYPWQQKEFQHVATVEAVGVESERHPFAGAAYNEDNLEWRGHIDTTVSPGLADHRVGDQTIFPGAGFLEIALSVARQWLRSEHVIISNFEIMKPLDLTNGETREVLSRVSPGSATIEIFSRPRLSNVPWLLNCRGKMLHGNAGEPRRGPMPDTAVRKFSGEDIYRLASASGLHYGPEFSLVTAVTVDRNGLLSVELADAAGPSPFLLDPMRTDASTHGIFTVFPELQAEERGVTYIPVRLDEAVLCRPYQQPARCSIEILRKSERSITANYYIYGADDAVVAVLRGVQCQAVPVRRVRAVEQVALVETPVLLDATASGAAGMPFKARDVLAEARRCGLLKPEIPALDDRAGLFEGWATAAAYEIAKALSDGIVIDVDALISEGRLPATLRPWLSNILMHLEAAGLMRLQAGTWLLVPDEGFPQARTVLEALMVECRSKAAELLLAAAVTGFVEKIKSSGSVSIDSDSVLTRSVLDFHDSTQGIVQAASDALLRIVDGLVPHWPDNRAVRVLQIGAGPAAQSLLSRFGDRVNVTILELNQRRYERLERSQVAEQGMTLMTGEHASKLGDFDLILSVGGLSRLPRQMSLSQLRTLLARDGLLVAAALQPSLFCDVVFGLEPSWFPDGMIDHPDSGRKTAGHWLVALDKAGFSECSADIIECDSEIVSLLVAEATPSEPDVDASESNTTSVPQFAVVTAAPSPFAAALSEALDASSGANAMLCGLANIAAAAARAVILIAPPAEADSGPARALTQRCMDIKACAEAIGDRPAKLWLIFSGALEAGGGVIAPVETGAWAFARTLANEFPNLDVRKIDVSIDLPPAVAAEKIRSIVLSETDETEIHIDSDASKGVRVRSLARIAGRKDTKAASSARLSRRAQGGARLMWQASERRPPAANEIEIEVAATGVNFRDLMWMLGLIPDEMLEDGFTGPTLGLECAGRIVAVGASVEDFKEGDRVAAFAAAAFSTHVTVPRMQAVKLSDAMSFEDAATIPVTFVTAYYSLITLANLQAKEWVLIHAGAGGVGMAAIQIAQARGARIIATAGSQAKRDLLSALGVKHVLDSRSTNFVDDVRAIVRAGVDVVLNSLAGEAMERSIACLAPFGRFVELGKRDYVTNTHIGLRPFRKNLSYFGVDVDQLIGGKQAVGERVYARVMQQFEKETYAPLPHCVFEAADVSEAFHLMQHSGHVGKIVVRPPVAGSVSVAKTSMMFDGNGTHLITGAFGGFGLETAKWLVDRGVRHLVLISRRGPVDAEAKVTLDAFAKRGVRVIAEACDVTDRKALERLMANVRDGMPPIVGVIHSAMVLDDAIIANLDADRFETVLAPKVTGAENLDDVTRDLTLDYFVLYSSVTTLMGNPGQGNYVAANAYMEGLARRRRQQGLPALAIGWGPIVDVGVVARSQRLTKNLQKLTGVTGLRAREALDLMALALARPSDTAVMTISPSGATFGSDRLPVLRSPTYAELVSQTQGLGENDAGRVDLHELVESEGIDAARRKVVDVIVAQLARVLHSREEDISRTRPLAEIGLDSLMALELVLNLEESFGIHVTLSGSAGVLTVSAVADEIIAHVDSNVGEEEAIVTTLAEQHLGRVEAGQVEALKELMTEGSQNAKRLLH